MEARQSRCNQPDAETHLRSSSHSSWQQRKQQPRRKCSASASASASTISSESLHPGRRNGVLVSPSMIICASTPATSHPQSSVYLAPPLPSPLYAAYVPCRGRKDTEIAGTSSSCAETEPVQIQPVMETEIADEKKCKEREETIVSIQGTEEARGSTSSKRSRVTDMHNLSERKRREKINERMKTLQELIPRCIKNDKASMLDNGIDYVKTLQMQVQIQIHLLGRVIKFHGR